MSNHTSNSSQPYKLPRRDLREPAFRRYEYFIHRALCGSHTLTPPDNQSASTFINRCRDAMLGFRRYNYTSIIVRGTDLSSIKLSELSNGQVHMENLSADKLNVLDLVKIKQPLTSLTNPPPIDFPTNLSGDDTTHHAIITTIVDRIILERITHPFIVKADTASSLDFFDLLKSTRPQLSGFRTLENTYELYYDDTPIDTTTID